MSPWSTVRHSPTPWTHTAPPRAAHDRSRRKPLSRVKTARDRATPARKEAQARRRQREAQRQGRAVQPQVDLVVCALQRCFVARRGFRAVSRVLSLLAVALGSKTAPCPHTSINGVTRRARVRLQAARLLPGFPVSQAPFSHGWIGMLDVRITLGAGTIVAVWALDAQHAQRTPAAPGLPQGPGLAGSVAASGTGDTP